MGVENFDNKQATDTPEEDEYRARHRLLSALRNGDIDIAYEANNGVSQDTLESESVQEAAKEGILMCTKMGDLDRIHFLQNFLNDPEKTFSKTEEARAAAVEGFQFQIRKENPHWTDLHLFGEISTSWKRRRSGKPSRRNS